MGEIMKIRCKACHSNWECMTGCGLQHGRKENIITAFQDSEQAPVIDWLSKYQIPLYDFKYQAVPCIFCKSLVSVPVLQGIEDDDIFIGTCPVCQGPIEGPLPEGVEETACPACGSMSLSAEEVGHWD